METGKDCADLRTKPFSKEVRGAVDAKAAAVKDVAINHRCRHILSIRAGVASDGDFSEFGVRPSNSARLRQNSGFRPGLHSGPLRATTRTAM